jgi:hypothetical protein
MKKRKINVRPLLISLVVAAVLWILICSAGFPDFPLNSWLGLGQPIEVIQRFVGSILTFTGGIGSIPTGSTQGAAHFYVSLLMLFLLCWAIAFAGWKIIARLRK